MSISRALADALCPGRGFEEIDWQHPHSAALLDLVPRRAPGASRHALRLSSRLATSFDGATANGKTDMQNQNNAQVGTEGLSDISKNDAKKNQDMAISQEAVAEARKDEEVKTLVEVREDADRRLGRRGGPSKIRQPGRRKPLPCLFGVDYNQDCPLGWVKSGTLFKKCTPPPPPSANVPKQNKEDPYMQWEPPEGSGCLREIETGLSPTAKQLLESRCKVSWPCVTNSKGEGGRGPATGFKPDYEPKPESICPTGTEWTYNQLTGNCDAPAHYAGGCGRSVNMLGYTPSMKAEWSHACLAAWPLVKVVKPPPPEPSPPSEEPEEKPDPDDPQGFRTSKRKGTDLPPRSDPSQAVWARCGHDYSIKKCPLNWTLVDDGRCVPPAYYTGVCPRAGTDISRFTPAMKEAFAKHCSAGWPCKGEFFLDDRPPDTRPPPRPHPRRIPMLSSIFPTEGFAAVLLPSVGALFL